MKALIKNNFIYPTTFFAGFALHYFNGEVIRLAREKFHIDADLYNGLPEKEYRDRYMKQLVSDPHPGISDSAHIKTIALQKLIQMVVFAIIEEVIFRHYIQKQTLPPLLKRVTPQDAAAARIAVSTFSHSFSHLLWNPSANTKSVKKAILIHTSLFALVAAVTSERFSLKAAIALHAGYNFRAWKCTYYDHFPILI